MDFDPTSMFRDASGFIHMALMVWALIVCGVLLVPAASADGEGEGEARRAVPRDRRLSRVATRRRRYRRPARSEPAEPTSTATTDCQ